MNVEQINNERELSKIQRFPAEVDFINIKFNPKTNVPIQLLSDSKGLGVSVLLTNYRLCILPVSMAYTSLELPLMSIDTYQFLSHTKHIEIYFKYLFKVELIFGIEKDSTSMLKAIENLSPNKLKYIPAFSIGKHIGASFNLNNFGWIVYDIEEEFKRQLSRYHCRQLCYSETNSLQNEVGIGFNLIPWFKVSNLHYPTSTYGAIPSYPFEIVLPAVCDETFIRQYGIHVRSKGRVPCVSYVHLLSGGVLSRSAQPLSNVSKELKMADAQICDYLRIDYESSQGKGDTESLQRKGEIPEEQSIKVSKRVNLHSMERLSFLSDLGGLSIDLLNDKSRHINQEENNSTHFKSKMLYIYDLRAKAAATANIARGGGFEMGIQYSNCKLIFCGIENIHAISNSWRKLNEVIQKNSGTTGKSFWSDVYDTRWYEYIQNILIASVSIAKRINGGNHCLVHCSDGWDRTAQCTSLAMLLLDPYYRTIHGFIVLIEKEFISMGHKFAERCGHQVQGKTLCLADEQPLIDNTVPSKNQRSPIFIQWLDCVFQILRQYPHKFEFTSYFLIHIAIHTYSCYYGTFLTNTYKERVFEEIALNTQSLWSDIFKMVKLEELNICPRLLLNSAYDSASAAEFVSKDIHSGSDILSISTNAKRIVFWEEFYLAADIDSINTFIYPNSLGKCIYNLNASMPYDICFKDDAFPISDVNVNATKISQMRQLFINRAIQRREKQIVFLTEIQEIMNVPLYSYLQMSQNADNTNCASDTDTNSNYNISKSNNSIESERSNKKCNGCASSFGLLTIGHHCYICRQKYCSKCYVSTSTGLKICTRCFKTQ